MSAKREVNQIGCVTHWPGEGCRWSKSGPTPEQVRQGLGQPRRELWRTLVRRVVERWYSGGRGRVRSRVSNVTQWLAFDGCQFKRGGLVRTHFQSKILQEPEANRLFCSEEEVGWRCSSLFTASVYIHQAMGPSRSYSLRVRRLDNPGLPCLQATHAQTRNGSPLAIAWLWLTPARPLLRQSNRGRYMPDTPRLSVQRGRVMDWGRERAIM